MNDNKIAARGTLYSDPSVHPFRKHAEIGGYGSSTPTGNDHNSDYSQFNAQPMFDFSQGFSSANSAPSVTDSAVQLQNPSGPPSLQATLNMNLWLQQNNPGLLAQLSQQSSIQVPGRPHTSGSPQARSSAAKALSSVSMPKSQAYSTASTPQPLAM